MLTSPEHRSPPNASRRTVRALAVSAAALGASVIIWRIRPSAPTASALPATDIVLGCAWVAWALAGYLSLAVAATALGQVVGALGGDGGALIRLAPARVSRLVEGAITLSIAAAVLGTSAAAPAGAATRHIASSPVDPSPAWRGALDWPGLSSPAGPVTTKPTTVRTAPAEPSPTRPHTPPSPKTRRHHAQVGLVSASPSPSASAPTGTDGEIVVRAGDSLWTIAARHLGPDASAEATVIAWHQWYAANRRVVGDDPDLIRPGQRLRPPLTAAAAGGDAR